MPLDPTAQNVGVGGMLFLSALWLLLKYKPWKNGDGGGNKKDIGQDIQALRIVILGLEGQGGLSADVRELKASVHKLKSDVRGLDMKCVRLEDSIKARRDSEGTG